MSSPSARSCPLCGGSNDCALARPGGRVADCWCVAERFPPELLAAVPDAGRSRCICRACLTRATETGEADDPSRAG